MASGNGNKGTVTAWIAVGLTALAMFTTGIRVVEKNTLAIKSLTQAVEKLEARNEEAIRIVGAHEARLTAVETHISDHDRRLDRLESK